jgi:hypothetical protein
MTSAAMASALPGSSCACSRRDARTRRESPRSPRRLPPCGPASRSCRQNHVPLPARFLRDPHSRAACSGRGTPRAPSHSALPHLASRHECPDHLQIRHGATTPRVSTRTCRPNVRRPNGEHYPPCVMPPLDQKCFARLRRVRMIGRSHGRSILSCALPCDVPPR